jgi:hypothetical protein
MDWSNFVHNAKHCDYLLNDCTEGRNPMTICIAAVCESGKKIVVATDRMLTFPAPLNVEFETGEQKIEELASNCIALPSGNTAFATEILESVRKNIGGTRPQYIAEIAERLKDAYISVRMAKTEETIIKPGLGRDYARALERGLSLPDYLQKQVNTYQQIAAISTQYNLVVDFIIAGLDDLGGHVSVVTHPGTLFSLDKMGYGAVGSGSMHATIHLSLNGQSRQKTFFETLYEVYVAKRISEVAPGVGAATDLAVIESTGVWHCTEPVIIALKKTYEEVTTKPSPKLDGLQDTYNAEHKL